MLTSASVTPLRLLTPAGQFDRSAIMRAAHVEARRIIAGAADLGCTEPYPYRVALREALNTVWQSARSHQWCARRDAALDAMPVEQARLATAHTMARMIDSTPAMLAELAAINAQAAAIGVRL